MSDSGIIVYESGDDLLDDEKVTPGVDFPMPEDPEAPTYGLDLPFTLGTSRDRKTGGTTKVFWTPKQFFPADIVHRYLWAALIRTSDFLMATMGVTEADQIERWEEVQHYVLTGEK
jgi:hypothetical protein